MQDKKLIIIGAGVAGLSAAIRLRVAGFEVTVLEANDYPGGKLSAFTLNGYRFDAGPSLFTLPHLVEELLLLAGKNPKKDFPYIKLEKGCHYFYEDGTRLIAYHNREKFLDELESKLKVNRKTVDTYLNKAEKRYTITAPIFLENSLHKLSNYFNLRTAKGILNMPKLNLFQSMNRENQDLLKHPHLVQYFNRFATYNGSNPYEAPALLNMIPHLEHNIGTFFPKGGMIQITQTLYQTALDLGVTFKFNQAAKQIILNNHKVEGVVTTKETFKASRVISNVDIHTTYTKLLSSLPEPTRLLQQEKSSSALIFYWGIQASFKELDLHNIFFSKNYEQEFHTIFKQKGVYADPTIYINITSKYKADDAPEGCENWFVMVNTAPNSGQNWPELIQQTRKAVIEKLSRMLGKDIGSLIACEQILDPLSIERKTGSYGGSLYGNASNNRFAAFLRQANFHHKIKGLYFCGGSAHPGGGIPLCLQSGKIVAEMVEEKG